MQYRRNPVGNAAGYADVVVVVVDDDGGCRGVDSGLQGRCC